MDVTISPVTPVEKLAKFSRRVRALSAKVGVGPIGFDLGRSALRAVQIQYGKSRPTLRSAISIDYPCSRKELLSDSKKLRRFISESMANHGFSGRKIVSCTPSENLRLLSLDYPVSDDVSEEQAIITLLAQRVDGDLSDYVIDYIPSREALTGDKRSALVAVADLKKQINYLELLRMAGLNVVGLEIGPIAIRRLVETVSRVEQIPNTLVVNCGVENTYLTVISGRRLMLDRGIKFGERYIIGRVAKALDMEYQDAYQLLYQYGVDGAVDQYDLIEGVINSGDIVETILEVIAPVFHELSREIEKVSAYVHSQLHGANIQQIFLLGSVARWPGADRYIGGMVDRPVSILNPFDSFNVNDNAKGALETSPVAGMALAAGCALSELR